MEPVHKGGRRRGTSITLEQMIQQWVMAPYIFQLNANRAAVWLAKRARLYFSRSFVMHGYFGQPSRKWKKRKRKYAHPILVETGTLRDSLTVRVPANYNPIVKRASVWTDPAKFRGNRRSGGRCYAAIHNAPSGTYTYGPGGPPTVQRQFMGHSTKFKEDIPKLKKILFRGIPG